MSHSRFPGLRKPSLAFVSIRFFFFFFFWFSLTRSGTNSKDFGRWPPDSQVTSNRLCCQFRRQHGVSFSYFFFVLFDLLIGTFFRYFLPFSPLIFLFLTFLFYSPTAFWKIFFFLLSVFFVAPLFYGPLCFLFLFSWPSVYAERDPYQFIASQVFRTVRRRFRLILDGGWCGVRQKTSPFAGPTAEIRSRLVAHAK